MSKGDTQRPCLPAPPRADVEDVTRRTFGISLPAQCPRTRVPFSIASDGCVMTSSPS